MAHSAPGVEPVALRPYTPQVIEKILADVTEAPPRSRVRVSGGDTAVLDQVTRRSKVTVTGQFGARLARHADAAGREAVVDTAERGGVGVGWARVLSGAENCARCVMLASRGPVYKSRESAGGGGRGFHDHCDCRAVLVRNGHDWEGREAFELYEDLWSEATKGYSGHAAELALRRELDRAGREGWTHQELLNHLRDENGSARPDGDKGNRGAKSTGAAKSTQSDSAFAANQVRVLEASLAKLEADGKGHSAAAEWQRAQLDKFRAQAGDDLPAPPQAADGGGGGGGPGSRPLGGGGDDDRVRLDDETHQWATDLSDEVRTSVALWQGRDRFYERVQDALLGETASDEAVQVADHLLLATSHPLQGEYTTWRGVRSSAASFGVADSDLERIVGETRPMDRFVSVSLHRSLALDEFTRPELAGGAVLIEVRLKPGTRVAWLAPVGLSDYVYQQEILLRPGTTQRIVAVDRSGTIPTVIMEVTP